MLTENAEGEYRSDRETSHAFLRMSSLTDATRLFRYLANDYTRCLFSYCSPHDLPFVSFPPEAWLSQTPNPNLANLPMQASQNKMSTPTTIYEGQVAVNIQRPPSASDLAVAQHLFATLHAYGPLHAFQQKAPNNAGSLLFIAEFVDTRHAAAAASELNSKKLNVGLILGPIYRK